MFAAIKDKLSLPVILLGLLSAYHFLVNIAWISLSTSPLPWDQAGHTRLVLRFVDFFQSGEFLKIINYFTISQYYPPLVHTLVAFPVMLIGNPIIVSEIMTTIFFLASLILLYLYASDLFKSRAIGLLSATLYSFFPIVVEHSRWFLLETPHMTFLLATLLFFHRSRVFQHKTYTSLFFLFMALGIVTKWLTIVDMIIPGIFTAITFFRQLKQGYQFPWKTIERGVLLFSAISLPWYLFNLSNLFLRVPANLVPESSDPQKILTFQNIFFYLYLFINFQLGLYLAIAFFISLVLFVLSKQHYRGFILSYIASIYLVFTFIPNKDWRYTMPMLPFVAMIIAFGLYKIYQWKKAVGVILCILLLGLMSSYTFVLSFRNAFNISYQRAVQIPLIGWIDYININDNLVRSYSNTPYPQESILKEIYARSGEAPRISVLCLIDQERFNAGNISLLRDMNPSYHPIDIGSPPAQLFKSDKEVLNYLETQQFAYALVAKEKVGVAATRNLSTFFQLKTFLENQPETTVSLVKEYELPNGDTISMYKLTFSQK